LCPGLVSDIAISAEIYIAMYVVVLFVCF
jgi:hypothetical protein